MPFNKITTDSKINQADQFVESFSETDKTFYYMFFGRHVPYPGGVVSEIDDSRLTTTIDAYSNMIFAKRILPTDVMLSIARIDWVNDSVYDAYDHRMNNIDLKQYYVGVLEGSNYNVFKCLFNNNGAKSVVSPSFASFSLVESSDEESYDGYYETSDGYQWKYMYTVSDDDMNKFSTNRFIPLTANSTVEQFAVSGSIDVILVEDAGAGYDNHFNGEFVVNSDIAYLGNNFFYALRSSANASPSSTNGFYTGCMMKITDGAGAGQFREIVDYVNSGNARYVVLEDTFTVLPNTTSKFEITPKVTINGGHDSPAVARGIIGSGNSISSVEMLDRGAGYFIADAAILQSNVVVQSRSATLVPIIPPSGGHGSNAKSELGASWVTMSIRVVGDENGAIQPGQKFSQVGILKDPKFANVELSTLKYSNTATPGYDGSFREGETIQVFDPIKQVSTVTIQSGNTTVLTNSTVDLPLDSLRFPDGKAYIQFPNSAWFVATVETSNTSQLTLDIAPPYTSNAAVLHISYPNTSGVFVSSTSTTINVTNATPFFIRGDKLIGIQTFSTAVVSNIQINNELINDFTAINQLSILSIDDPISTMSADDFISDQSNTSSCYVHSYANANHIYVTNVRGDMSPGTILTNVSGDASVTIADKYNGQIVQESGSIIYLENHEPVNRATSTAQTKKIIVEF